MLEYENESLLELVGEDGLCIMAKGLGIERIFTKFLHIYADPGNLVLVIGTNRKEENIFIDWLIGENGEMVPPRIVSAECNANDRSSMYLEGGVLFVTSRILVVDLLLNRVPIEQVTGILVYKAHKLIESSQEAFILRLFREKNKKGFVKAFSESPQAFTRGFCQVERIMRNLFVQKLYLWPRFHATVGASLEKSAPEVIEVHVKMSPSMVAIQMALLDLISICAKELKRCNPTLDTDELTVENAVAKSFDKLIRLQLDPMWNQLSGKTRQLVSDLQLLRLILGNLTECDSVSFYNHIYALRTSEKTFQESNWLILDSAEALFVNAKNRVFRGSKPQQNKASNADNDDDLEIKDDLLPEENPKWKVLNEILSEIEQDFAKKSAQPVILILVNEEQSANQLREILCHGSKKILTRLFKKTSIFRGKKYAEPMKSSDNEEASVDYDDQLKSITSKEIYIRCSKNKDEPFGIANIIKQIWPAVVIMYDVELSCVRQLEAFKARYPQSNLKVYFLVYADSVEEQAYLTTLRREKQAFDLLIKEKATMVIPQEQDGRSENNFLLLRDPRRANETVNAENTRHGGRSNSTETKKILVDMREFRSELPSLIHRRGIDIIPMTLEVGDYILTPEICVERKSVSDLIGSLNSGRLYNQAMAMVRHYSKPMLLIEFDQNKAFSLQSSSRYSMPDEVSAHDFTSKLLLLTLHFPQLRLLWCSSPYATAELFQELKEGHLDPKVDEASAIAEKITNDHTGLGNVEKYNSAPLDVLMKLPGINTKNCHSILNHVPSLAALSSMSQEKLETVLGNSVSAKSLWESLNLPMDKLEGNFTAPKKGFWKRKRRR